MKSEVMNLRIRVLHAVDYPEIAQKFYEGHKEVLKEYKVEGKTSSIEGVWWENPYSYMFIVEDLHTGEIAAGIRVDVITKPNHTLFL